MNKQEIIDKLSENGIHQLRKGESMKDALDYVEGKLTSRKGYQYKTDCGDVMNRGAIIAASNKEAYSKYVSVPTYVKHDLDDPNIIPKEDIREEKDEAGIIQPCQFCGAPMLTDDMDYGILNCEDCFGYAILTECM